MEFKNFWSLDKIPYPTINFFFYRDYIVLGWLGYSIRH